MKASGPKKKRLMPITFLFVRIKSLVKHPALGALTLLGNGTIVIQVGVRKNVSTNILRSKPATKNSEPVTVHAPPKN